MSDLFREEVVERQTSRLHGDILVLPGFSHALMLGFLLFWVTLIAVWLASGSYARKETVSGWLEPNEGVTRIYGEDGGLIRQVLVHEGERVESGQPLIIINGDRHLEGGGQLESQLLEEYKTQRQLLTEQRAHTERLHQRRHEELEQEVAAARQDLQLLGEQLETLSARHLLVREVITRNETLHAQQFISSSELESSVARELALRNERQALLREQNTRRNSLGRLLIELEALPDESAKEKIQLQSSLSDLARSIAQLNGQRSYVVRAPKPGVVSNLQARVGKKVHAGSTIPLLTLAPDNAQLTARLLVPVRSVGFVEPGQAIDIRYEAFPYQKFGLYRGEVVTTSDTVLLPNEVVNAPLKIEEPVYRITAKLQQSMVQAYGREFRLKQGMTLSADLRLGERTLLQWLLEPIYSLKGRL